MVGAPNLQQHVAAGYQHKKEQDIVSRTAAPGCPNSTLSETDC
jgi:hypothetical protein